MCADGYYNKGVYVQLIRLTIRLYFRGRQHGRSRMKMCISEKLTCKKSATIHVYLTKRSS